MLSCDRINQLFKSKRAHGHAEKGPHNNIVRWQGSLDTVQRAELKDLFSGQSLPSFEGEWCSAWSAGLCLGHQGEKSLPEQVL